MLLPWVTEIPSSVKLVRETEKASRKGTKMQSKPTTYSQPEKCHPYISEAPKLTISPNLIVYSFLPLRLCAFA